MLLLLYATVQGFGPVGHNALPHLHPLDAKALDGAHGFSRTANWLIPGRVMCGHYPGSCPSRPAERAAVEERMQHLRGIGGVNTFVCLQHELLPQDSHWPDEGIPKGESLSERAKWSTANFLNYKEAADASGGGATAKFAHFGMEDMSVADSLDELDSVVCDLAQRVHDGDVLYLHCWGGRGRTGLVAACLLGALYPELSAEQGLERVQRYYALRQQDSYGIVKTSPETDEQRQQVRDWYSFKRLVPSVIERSGESYGIWDKRGAELLEVVSPSAIHPLTRTDALRRISDADTLGRGMFGHVFRAIRCEPKGGCGIEDEGNMSVAIKCTWESAPSYELSRHAIEAEVLGTLGGERGFAKLLYEGHQTVFGRPSDVLVMEVLGVPVQARCWKQEKEDVDHCFCDGTRFSTAAMLHIGRDVLQCLEKLHGAGYVHNDVKPLNMLWGADGSEGEDHVHLVDFGMVLGAGECQPEGCDLSAGGATPLFASANQLEGMPTHPADDLESLWYCLAFLAEGTLPWNWEPAERVQKIKRQLLSGGCAISSSPETEPSCDAYLTDEDYCSTEHCKVSSGGWAAAPELDALWAHVVDAHASGIVDYEGCLAALGDPLCDVPE
jgi:hypothetical protein